MYTYQALPGSSRFSCVNIKLSLTGKILLAITSLLSLGVGISLYLYEQAEPQIDLFCPSNGICDGTSVLNVLKYQRCVGSKAPPNTWCEKLNCSESSCAQYQFNCGLETSEGLFNCVPLLPKSNGWCSSRGGTFFFFVLFSIFFTISLIICLFHCLIEYT